jgi:hypothetical protein
MSCFTKLTKEMSHHQDGKIVHLQLTIKIGEILTDIYI